VFDTDDEVVSGVEEFAAKVGLSASRLSAIGAFQYVKLGYFDLQRKEYEPIDISDQVEVLSLLGDIALDGQRPKQHAHCVVGHRDGSTRGGHLLQAVVLPTLEVLLIESPAHLRRCHDSATGLALIRLDEDDGGLAATADGPSPSAQRSGRNLRESGAAAARSSNWAGPGQRGAPSMGSRVIRS
jgi:predicted DNA-binding protein with PD1-like motif